MELELEWIHGYRSDDSRNNVRYNADGEIVYIAAGVGIAYNQVTHKQRWVVDAQGRGPLALTRPRSSLPPARYSTPFLCGCVCCVVP